MGISPLIIGGLIAGGGAVASSAINASSAGSAANAQVQAANTAAQTQLAMYSQTRQDLQPWMTSGSAANTQLASLYGIGTGPGGASTAPNSAAMTSALENTPGYQFTLGQGTKALDRSAASQGLLLSGGQLQAAQQYGQGLAETNAWQPYVNELNQFSTTGQNAAAGVGSQGTIAAANAGSAQLAGGTAAANGYLGAGAAITGGINGASGYLQSLYGSSYGGSGAAAAAYGASPGAITNSYANDPLANPFAA